MCQDDRPKGEDGSSRLHRLSHSSAELWNDAKKCETVRCKIDRRHQRSSFQGGAEESQWLDCRKRMGSGKASRTSIPGENRLGRHSSESCPAKASVRSYRGRKLGCAKDC